MLYRMYEFNHKDYFTKTITRFQNNEIDFYDFKKIMIGSLYKLPEMINFQYDVYNVIDNWFEYIEFCYLEEDWHQLSMELGKFILNGIENYPQQVSLPENSRLVKEQFSTYLD